MTSPTLLASLMAAAVTFVRKGDDLRVKGPKVALRDDTIAELVVRKRELLAILDRNWLAATGELLVRSIGTLDDEVLWAANNDFVGQVQAMVAGGVCRTEAERIAYEAVAVRITIMVDYNATIVQDRHNEDQRSAPPHDSGERLIDVPHLHRHRLGQIGDEPVHARQVRAVN